MSLTFTAALRANKPKRNVGFIDAGVYFSLGLQKNGRAWGWGNNGSGQLGDNSMGLKSTPVAVVGTIKTFCRIDAGGSFSLATDKNGRAWAWGLNSSGQLGDNSVTARLTPVSVVGAVKTFCQISAGSSHSLAIDKNGRVWSWGDNTSGQLGDNSVTSRLTPVSVLGGVKTFCAISAGNGYSLSIDKNGRAWGWGNNTSGRLGDNSVTSRLTPVSVLGAVKTFCRISIGVAHSLSIDKNGGAWAWGDNSNGRLGDNSVTSRLTPVSVLGGVKTFCQISAGQSHSIAIDKNGRVWSWGDNTSGQLGDNSFTSRLTPVSVLGSVKTFCAISAGTNHSLAIDKNGRAWAWGYDQFNELGHNRFTSRSTPVAIAGQKKTFCHVGTGYLSFAGGVDKNGIVWMWGENGIFGKLGTNGSIQESTPVNVYGATKTFCQISVGSSTLAIDKNGRAWGWGPNASGQLGDNTTTNRLTPVSVLGAVKTFCKIAVGIQRVTRFGTLGSTIAIDKYGRAWGWGSFIGVGDNTTTNRLTPVSVLGAVKTFCEISGGWGFSSAIEKNGMIWSWGSNNLGQLGNGTTALSVLTPVSIAGSTKTFCKIDNGYEHSAAIDKYGRAWAWGVNTAGYLGDGTTTNRCTPVSVAGAVKTFCHISAGFYFTFALDKYGRAWGWGDNTAGYLGDGTTTNRCTPVSVAGVPKTFCKIFTSGFTVAAIDKYGNIWSWGSNGSGEFGNGAPLYAKTPVKVCNI